MELAERGCEARDYGFEELEMGRSKVDNSGLIAFKEHWGASGTLISYWTYPHKSTKLLSIWKKKSARFAVSTVPDVALETVGKLLHRHIG